MENRTPITVSASINATVEKVWEFWNNPEHIKNWAFASADWHAPKAENDLHIGGKFSTTMAAKDGKMSFDFGGTYTAVEENKLIEYTLADDRRVKIVFEADGDKTLVTETFDAEETNPVEMQQIGWQAILNNFKKLAEEN
ncbi:SRPBCC family protein [Pedobacter fastidiosus]|uniref:SRPBCC family protein n=1 Tax=Pedobacter fastidiosus TaxID=2765361 RepID=A0ABR7KRP3_9SPHI|nr:SRPBCC family protein [Pedobacter fastidiosus]MBC6110771.1 SRPBCC family protein [Pedobacter fastidiosus]